MKTIKNIYLPLLALLLTFTSCSSDDEGVQSLPTETMTLIISVPQGESTRIGDPGSAVDEGEDWDRLTILVAYTDGVTEHPTLVSKTLTKEEFNKLDPYREGSPYKMLSLNVWRGMVNIYGFTYSSGADTQLETGIKECTSDDEIKALAISNDYASKLENSTAKFLSVATGYKENYVIGTQDDASPISPIPSLTLTRLAANIDIQWDAADAYEAGYTDVKVTDFQYKGDVNTTITDAGRGRLFPALNSGSERIAGTKTFYNTTEISQRNGRVYHYTFPDGVSTPSVKFNISAKKDNVDITPDGYTLNFNATLQQATWYKVNATIKGITGNGTITIGNSQSTVTTP